MVKKKKKVVDLNVSKVGTRWPKAEVHWRGNSLVQVLPVSFPQQRGQNVT